MSTSVNFVPPVATTPDESKEKVLLNKLLQQYTRDLKQGQTPAQLQVLAKQIQAAALAAGEHVRLPTINASTTSKPATPPTPSVPSTSTTNMTA